MHFVPFVLAAGTGLSAAHLAGLELEHAHSQAAWPLEHGDEALLQRAAALMPRGTFTWEEQGPQGGDWTWPLLRKSHEDESREAMILHMLHRHGMAPLLASHSPDFPRYLRAFEPEEADRADVTSNRDTEAAKTLVLAEQAFGPIAELRAILSQVSLSGLRNLHSYDHDGHWRCSQDSAPNRGGEAVQAALSPTTLAWLGNHGLSGSANYAVQREFSTLFNSVVREAWESSHMNMNAFLGLGDGSWGTTYKRWGAIAPVDEWVTDRDGFQYELILSGNKCGARGVITWQEAQTNSQFQVPLDTTLGGSRSAVAAAGACRNLYQRYQSDKASVKEEVSGLVKAWVEKAVQKHRGLLRQRRSVMFAEEESRLVEAGGLPGSAPKKPSECNSGSVRRHCDGCLFSSWFG